MMKYMFQHLIDVLMISGFLLLLLVGGSVWYQKSYSLHSVSQSLRNMSEMVDALQLYSFENPKSHVFPPSEKSNEPGIVLCPIKDNNRRGLSFLTTPVAYLSSIQPDPFMEDATDELDPFPLALHWIRYSEEDIEAYRHIGWGSLSVGPALQLPPQYNLNVLQQVPRHPYMLRDNMFDPSNGLESFGILYIDSLGNRTNI